MTVCYGRHFTSCVFEDHRLFLNQHFSLWQWRAFKMTLRAACRACFRVTWVDIILKVSVCFSAVSSKPFAILHKIENPQRCKSHQNKRWETLTFWEWEWRMAVFKHETDKQGRPKSSKNANSAALPKSTTQAPKSKQSHIHSIYNTGHCCDP